MHVNSKSAIAAIALAGLYLMGCGGSKTSAPPVGPPEERRAEFVPQDNGAVHLAVDASDENSWVSLDLDASRVDEDSARWDIAISRFHVRLNGGISGDQGVQIVALPGAQAELLTRAPGGPYVSDEAKQGTDPGTPDFVPAVDADLAFERAHAASETGWYAYNPATHVLSPSDALYVLRSSSGAYYGIQWLDYYDEFGTPGYVQLRFWPIEAPQRTLSVPAQTLAQLRLRDQAIVEAAEDSLDWDLMVMRSAMRTNSGVSGPGLGGARWAPDGEAFDELSGAPTVGYEMDVLVPIAGPPGSGEAPGNPVLRNWYDYDSVTHMLSPKAGTLLVRGARGDYAKIEIQSYEDGLYSWRIQPVMARPQTHELSFTLQEVRTYISFDTGRVHTSSVGEPQAWDIALDSARVRVRAGAQPFEGDFEDLLEASAEGYVMESSVGGRPEHELMTQWLASGQTSAMWQISRGEGQGYAKIALQRRDEVVTIRYVFSGVQRARYD